MEAANNLHTSGIIGGYPDGSFGASNNVNRAELAVMLDRFETRLDNKIDTIKKDTDWKLEKSIRNTLKQIDEEIPYYTSFVILAESDLYELDWQPEAFGTADWQEDTSALLPTGYSLYSALLYPSDNPSYLHFVGDVCEGDVCGIEKDQWYGPFYY